MTRLRSACIILLLASFAAGNAWSHRGHGHAHRRAHVDVVIGLPLTGAWHYRAQDVHAYPYSYPPVIAVPAPTVYIERDDAPQVTEPQPDPWWYYCPSAQGYYPYVPQCPQGWQRVVPQPPDLR